MRDFDTLSVNEQRLSLDGYWGNYRGASTFQSLEELFA